MFWAPRVLAIVFIAFLSIFAFDVFGEYGFPEILIALFMHLIPSILLVVALVIAWKQPFLGGICFSALGIATIICFRTYSDPIVFLIITLPILLVGGLFLFEYYFTCRRRIKKLDSKK